jgi:hypothetical protein
MQINYNSYDSYLPKDFDATLNMQMEADSEISGYENCKFNYYVENIDPLKIKIKQESGKIYINNLNNYADFIEMEKDLIVEGGGIKEGSIIYAIESGKKVKIEFDTNMQEKIYLIDENGETQEL